MDNYSERINYMNDDSEEEIDLLALAFNLLIHWKLIVFSTLFLGVSFLLFSKYLITPIFESTSELYILDSSTSISSLADIQIGNSLASDYVLLVKSRPVMDEVIENLNLEEDYKQLESKVNVVNSKDTHIISITVKDPSALRAKMITDEIAKVSRIFIEEKMGQKQPSIIHYGYADGDKVSPSVSKNSIIGALAGFAVSTGFLTLAYLINDSITIEEDVERKLGLNVLGSVPYSDTLNIDDSSSKNKKKSKSGGGK